jgi:hypothetical protein
VRAWVSAWVRAWVRAWMRACEGAWVRGCVGAWVRGFVRYVRIGNRTCACSLIYSSVTIVHAAATVCRQTGRCSVLLRCVDFAFACVFRVADLPRMHTQTHRLPL